MSKIVLQDQMGKLKEKLEEVENEIQELKQQFLTEEEDQECVRLETCNDCCKSLKCGWCVLEERCVRGDNIGPFFTTCNFYNYQYCSGKGCSKLVDCDSCLRDERCGWCEDKIHMVLQCLEQEPMNSICPSQGWYHSEGNKQKCPKVESEQQQEYKQEKKARKQNKSEEPIQRERVKSWEEKFQEEKSKILEQRQKELQADSPNTKFSMIKMTSNNKDQRNWNKKNRV